LTSIARNQWESRKEGETLGFTFEVRRKCEVRAWAGLLREEGGVSHKLVEIHRRKREIALREFQPPVEWRDLIFRV